MAKALRTFHLAFSLRSSWSETPPLDEATTSIEAWTPVSWSLPPETFIGSSSSVSGWSDAAAAVDVTRSSTAPSKFSDDDDDDDEDDVDDFFESMAGLVSGERGAGMPSGSGFMTTFCSGSSFGSGAASGSGSETETETDFSFFGEGSWTEISGTK